MSSLKLPKVDLSNSRDVEHIFKSCFFSRYNTVLVGGADEPLYLPAGHAVPAGRFATLLSNVNDNSAESSSLNTIFYREDFFASSLHEVSHWCIAGQERRQQLDFGYWYEADGRSGDRQQAFFDAEVKPQALELLFSIAVGFNFRVSVDNLDGEPVHNESNKTEQFTRRVIEQARCYVCGSLPERAELFIKALGLKYSRAVNTPSLNKALDDYVSLFGLQQHNAIYS